LTGAAIKTTTLPVGPTVMPVFGRTIGTHTAIVGENLVRFISSTLLIPITIAALAGCSSGTAATPSAGSALANQTATASAQNLGRIFDPSNVKPGSSVEVALQTYNGDYVTAVNGGTKEKQTNCGSGQVALHENARSIGLWERFKEIPEGNNTYAFQTSNGEDYITAVNGGGMGAPNRGRNISLLHTNATSVGPWEKFFIVSLTYPYVAIETPDQKHYVTAVNGGGCGVYNKNDVPFHTDATTVGSWEKFTLIPE
jgi:hypothetical protein